MHCYITETRSPAIAKNYIRSPASEFQSWRKSDLSEARQFRARYVNETQSRMNSSVTDIARGHFAR